MQLFLVIILSLAGFLLLFKGGDYFVDNAVMIAKKLNVPVIIIGATIVSIGTTLPEILVSVFAAVKGNVELAGSNATGSMFCNLTLILGVTLASAKLTIDRKTYLEKFIFSIVGILLLTIFMIDGNLSLIESIVLLIVFVVFMTVNIVTAVKQSRLQKANNKLEIEKEMKGDDKEENNFSAFTIIFFILGATMIAVGAVLLCDNIVILAEDYLKIPSAVVGATFVALGTSLPELVTAIKSVKSNNIDMSIGNVLGANIINGTFLVGISGAIQGTNGMQLFTNGGSLAVVIAVIGVFVGLAILITPILIKEKTYKWQGVTLISLYALYIIYIVISVII